LLAESAWFDGRISMQTSQIDVPLDDLLASNGTAIITLHQVRSGPSNTTIVGLLDMLASLRKQPPQHELVFIDGSRIEVTVKDWLVMHQGLQVGLPKVDTRLQLSSSGSVGMKDQALNLQLQFPVPLEQLARRESVKELGVPMVKLPITGKLTEPKIQWNALREDSADILGLIRQKVQEEAPATAALLGGLEGLAEPGSRTPPAPTSERGKQKCKTRRG
jgi:hypothetical protein